MQDMYMHNIIYLSCKYADPLAIYMPVVLICLTPWFELWLVVNFSTWHVDHMLDAVWFTL